MALTIIGSGGLTELPENGSIEVMQLTDYLKQQGESATAFGLRAKISAASMSRILRGSQVPRADIMSRIVAATGGAVQPNDFYSAPPERAASGEAAA